jgi:hypothetical protein
MTLDKGVANSNEEGKADGGVVEEPDAKSKCGKSGGGLRAVAVAGDSFLLEEEE